MGPTTDSFVQVPVDSTGKKIDNSQVTTVPGADPQNPLVVQRQRINLADAVDPTNIVPVMRRRPTRADPGLFVRVVPQEDQGEEPLTQHDALSKMVFLLEALLEAQEQPNLRDALPSIFESSLIKVGGVLARPKFIFANIAASTTDGPIIAASGGRKLRVLSYRVMAGGTATDFTFNSQKGSAAGVAISEKYACGANGGISVAHSAHGHFETNASEGLTGTTGTGSTVGVGVVYVEVLPVALPPIN